MSVLEQEQIAENLEARGYYHRSDGTRWTGAQIVARNLAKLVEEVGEIAEEVVTARDGCGDAVWASELQSAAYYARRAFDHEVMWDGANVYDLDKIRAEVDDCFACLANLVKGLEMLDGKPHDIAQGAVVKTTDDIERGRR